ncbi:MAG: hypothetical protein R3E44_15585 [Paracoccaceae bacterium]
MTNAEIEGRLLAQRQTLARLTARVAADPGGAVWLEEALPDNPIPQDGQEDPGAVPDAAFAIEAARADELRMIGIEARRRLRREVGP